MNEPMNEGMNEPITLRSKRRLRDACLAVMMLLATSATSMMSAGCRSPMGSAGLGQTSSSAPAGGAELWADNCARCHNMRPPDQYSSKEWGIIMIHMRVRAGLTGEEGQAIRAFLEGGQ